MRLPIGILFVNMDDPASLQAIFTLREVAKTTSVIKFAYSSSEQLKQWKPNFGINWPEEPAFVINNQVSGQYLALPWGKPITFANLWGMIDGFNSGNWDVSKFHLPDDVIPEL